MRIAVSGTHFMGKSTLIEDFIKRHPDYTYEVEPYYQLQEEGEFSLEPSLESFLDQLDYSISNFIRTPMKKILFMIDALWILLLMPCVR